MNFSKRLALLLFTIMTCYIGQAQEMNTIGLRVGDSDGTQAEVSYQRYLNADNRIEATLGLRDSEFLDVVQLMGVYQYVFPLDGNFNWYAGAGAGLLSISVSDDDLPGDNDDSALYGVLAGQAGIEYNFEFPLTLSIDTRPEIYLGDGIDLENEFIFSFALGIRYRF